MYIEKAGLSNQEHNETKATSSRSEIIAGMFAEVNRPESEKKAEKKREKRRRGWWRTRIGALNKVFGGPRRYGDGRLYQFSDDDAGREDLCILLDHYAYSNPAAMPRIIKARAPWLTEPERESLMEQVGRHSRYWKSQALAGALGLTEAERISLGGVPTIGAIDVTPDERRAMRKQRNTQGRRQKRRAAGMKPQADSISRRKPWKAQGISRAKWYRDRPETTLSAVNLVNTAGKTVSLSKSSPPLPTQQGADVVPFRVKPNQSPRPATQPAWKEAA